MENPGTPGKNSILSQFSSDQILITLHPPTPSIATEEFNFLPRSPLKSTTSSTGFLCRICHEYENSEDMITPCECSGSMAMVHQTCLTTWLIASGNNFCEICGKYLIIPNQQIQQQTEPKEEKWLSPSWITIILLLMFSIGLSFFYCSHFTDNYMELWVAATLLTFNIIACGAICFHTFYSRR